MRIKNKLEKELDGIVKSFDENPNLTARIPSRSKSRPMRRSVKIGLFSSASVLAALCVALTVMLAIPRLGAPTEQYLTIEINPAVAFTIENGSVVRASSLNADCDVILSDGFEKELIGLSAEKASELFVDRAMRLGYIDYDEPTAVKVSCDETLALGSVKTALVDYFKDRGIYAVVAAGELACDLHDELSYGDEYIRREIIGKSGTELAKSYSSAINAGIVELMRSGLASRIDEYETYKVLLAELDELNTEIENHADNPLSMSVKDYFILKDFAWLYPSEKYSQDFARLMKQFERKLDEYGALGGAMFSSGFEIKAAINVLDLIPYETLRELASDISDITSDMATALVDMLKYIGFDISEQLMLADVVPTTVDDYLDNIEKLYAAQSAARLEENSSLYNAERPKIADADYDSFVMDIIERYGSLDGYYESKK